MNFNGCLMNSTGVHHEFKGYVMNQKDYMINCNGCVVKLECYIMSFKR